MADAETPPGIGPRMRACAPLLALALIAFLVCPALHALLTCPRRCSLRWPLYTGKGSSEWVYAWIPVVAPFAGGAIAGGLFLAVQNMNHSALP